MNPIGNDFRMDVQQQPDFNMHVQDGLPEIEIDVQERGDDVHLGVKAGNLIPPDRIVTDFPDSNDPNGNTMKCLEQALLDEVGQGNLTGREREVALTNLRVGVTKVRSKILKEGPRADDSVVADTYQDPRTGKKYYKFLITWEIDVTINGEPKTIRKSQWTITGVEQPTSFKDPSLVRYSHHFALLSLKCHRHIHKAGLNPAHADYKHVRDCVDDLRSTNIVGQSWSERLAFTTHLLATEYDGDDRSWALEDTIGLSETANALGVTLKSKSGKSVNIYIDTANQGRKVDETGQKYLKKAFNHENPDQSYVTLGQKLKKQSNLMAIRGNPDIDNYLDVIQAKPENVEEVLESIRFEGVNDRGMTFYQVKDELLSARKAQSKIHQRNAKLSGMKFQNAVMQIYAPKLGESKIAAFKLMLSQVFKSEYKFNKSILKEMQGETLAAGEKRRLQEALEELESVTNDLKASQQSVKLQNLDSRIEHIMESPLFSEDQKDTMIRHLQSQAPDLDNLPKSKEVRQNEKLIALARALLEPDA